MAVFPSDSIRTKNWGSEVLTDADLEGQFDLLHAYFQAALNATSGHAHTGSSNQGPKISPANLLIASQATGDTLYASSATAWARLPKGTASQLLAMKSDATIPEWASFSTFNTAANALAGSVVNHKIATDNTAATGTGDFPHSISSFALPEVTEGDALTALNTAFGTFTPTKAGNIIVFEAIVTLYVVGGGNSGTATVAIFTGASSTAIAAASSGEVGAGTGTRQTVSVRGYVTAADTSAITPSVRVAGYATSWATHASNMNSLRAYEIKV